MMNNRNTSASVFGWDFQVNSAILLMLENIKEAKSVRVEGASEDIEITLNDNLKVYAQVKSVVKPDDTANVINKLTKALKTLSDAAKNGDGSLFTYVTNSPNPFNNKQTLSYFIGRTHLHFDELPNFAQNKIKSIIKTNKYSDLDVHKLDIRIIPFYGSDLKNRYKEIQACVNEFLTSVNIDEYGINTSIMEIWQRDFFHNATKSDNTISISKKEMIWPLIVLVIDKTVANEYKKDFNDDEIEEINGKYKMIINQNTMSYNIISRILSDYIESKMIQKQFVVERWCNYLDITNNIDADDNIKESIVKIILYKILINRRCISNIKGGTNL